MQDAREKVKPGQAVRVRIQSLQQVVDEQQPRLSLSLTDRLAGNTPRPRAVREPHLLGDIMLQRRPCQLSARASCRMNALLHHCQHLQKLRTCFHRPAVQLFCCAVAMLEYGGAGSSVDCNAEGQLWGCCDLQMPAGWLLPCGWLLVLQSGSSGCITTQAFLSEGFTAHLGTPRLAHLEARAFLADTTDCMCCDALPT